MPQYTDKNAGDPWLAADGNALADDIGSPTLGHQHDGTDGHGTLLPDAIGDGASITWDGRVLFDQGGNLASGTTVTPGTDGNYFHVTGTTTITAIATLQAGTLIWLTFDGALQITHNATSLILRGGSNITTVANEVYAFVSEGSGNWREIARLAASSDAVTALNSATENELVTVGSTTTELDAESSLTYDGAILTLGGGQIAFPATQSASAGANTLDDYEEGTFTPTLQDDTRSDAESQTYSHQVGRYVKIGRIVHVQGSMLLTSIGSLTTGQSAVIAGMPFTAQNTANVRSPFAFANMTGLALGAAGDEVLGFIEANGTVIHLQLGDVTTGQTAMTVAEVSADGAFAFQGVYEV